MYQYLELKLKCKFLLLAKKQHELKHKETQNEQGENGKGAKEQGSTPHYVIGVCVCVRALK